ncbi:MAG: outer membrane protein assembly factor BamA [Betaproteobacteria bacterium]|nr:outer membrane protein assembly factor BamA [Betaproteobacteria bacterium]
MIRRITRTAALLLASLIASRVLAFEPFTVKDIRVEGIQRTEAGTVFSYLPVKVGERLDDAKAAAAIRALYATGFFKDVRLEADGDVLVVTVLERPAIAQIEFVGAKEFGDDKLKENMKQIGLSEGRIFDRNLLEQATQDLKGQYLSRGKYSAQIKSELSPMERNRVAITFTITEGEVAKIRQINIIGNKEFKESVLLDIITLRTPGMFTWYSKNDQYSRQKLEADLESLRSFYLNQGFLEFSIDSTQVAISAGKEDIFITVNITEGKRYTTSEIRFAGELIVSEAELRKDLKLKVGEEFSRERLAESVKLMSDRLGNSGYAFANVNPVPELDKQNGKVAYTLYVDPGRMVYVRRIDIAGNVSTRDEVIRRELRQMEGAWYSTEKLRRSKTRVDKLGYFAEVAVDTVAVPGAPDQVDINVTVTERPTGSLLLGVGYSSTEKVVLTGTVSENNVFGSGNNLTVQVNSGSVNTVYALSFTNPYYTDDGVSLGFDAYRRDVDASSLSVATYNTNTYGFGLRVGVPVTETDTVSYGLSFEHTNLEIFDSSPVQYQDFVATFGNTTTALIGSAGWSRDKRDSVIYTTTGSYQRLHGEVAMPGANLRFYRTTYQYQWFSPMTKNTTLALNGQIGLADGYSDKPLPFYKNFYLGGVGSLRGFSAASIGPKDSVGNALGGKRQIIGSAEVLFPFPGLQKDKSVRLSVFLDAGTLGDTFDLGETRYSTGIAMGWYSPAGPLKFSFGRALNDKPGDKLQTFQFSLGTLF